MEKLREMAASLTSEDIAKMRARDEHSDRMARAVEAEKNRRYASEANRHERRYKDKLARKRRQYA